MTSVGGWVGELGGLRRDVECAIAPVRHTLDMRPNLTRQFQRVKAKWNNMLSACADTIWQIPAYLPYVQAPLTDTAVKAAEREIGHPLPAEYVALLRRQNGGYIRYELPDMVHDKIAGIGSCFPSVTDFDWDECQPEVGFPLQGLVPFDGDGHWHICLDYRQNSVNPAVTYVDVECDQQSPIAESFAAYLQKLRVRVGEEYVVLGISDIEMLKSRLSATLAVKFDPPDDWASGVLIHRATLDAGTEPGWFWISPNTVPRGFVRPDDPRFAKLKGLLPGSASRFPEIPAESYILSAAAAVRSRVLEGCSRSHLSVRPLRDFVQAK